MFFGRFSINGGQNIFLSFSFLIVNSLSPGKRQIFSFDSSQSIEHHFDFPLLIAQSILWYLYRASNWKRVWFTQGNQGQPLCTLPGAHLNDATKWSIYDLIYAQLGRGGGYTPFYGLYGLERGTFFQLQVHKSEGISLVEVRKRVGQFILVCSGTRRGHTDVFWRCEKEKRTSWFLVPGNLPL